MEIIIIIIIIHNTYYLGYIWKIHLKKINIQKLYLSLLAL